MTIINYAKYDQNGYTYEIGLVEDKFVEDMIKNGEPVIYIDPPQNLHIGFRVNVATKQIVTE
jgi:hypothetical protein